MISAIGTEKVAQLWFATLIYRDVHRTSGLREFCRGLRERAMWMVQDGHFGFTDDDVCQVVNACASVGLLQPDADCDGELDAPPTDRDGDGVTDDVDNCVRDVNPRQLDLDDDGVGDVCDDNIDGDDRWNWSDSDIENDGIKNYADNCPYVPNWGQEDVDEDGIGDVCEDSDADGLLDSEDNCPLVSNGDQLDLDDDGEGDPCDDDRDGDELENSADPCPDIASGDHDDADGDGFGAVCDNCVDEKNGDQIDTDHDGLGDMCDPDADGDGVDDEADNCPNDFNPAQIDGDGNGMGWACDRDEQSASMVERVTGQNRLLDPQPRGGLDVPLPVCLDDCPAYVSATDSVSVYAYATVPFSMVVIDELGQVVSRGLLLEAETADYENVLTFRPLNGALRVTRSPFSQRRYLLRFLPRQLDSSGFDVTIRVTTSWQ